MEQKQQSNDELKSPEIQDIIISSRIGIIVAELAERLEISPEKAFDLFYESKTCANLHNKTTGLYLYGNKYIADEFMIEYRNK